jgi:peptidyl-tRNA hydrolase
MNGAGGKVAAIFLGPHISSELDRITAALKLLAERSRGE